MSTRPCDRRRPSTSGSNSATSPKPHGTTWARECVLTRMERASGLAKRPYDLRHAGISFWLYSGADPAE